MELTSVGNDRAIGRPHRHAATAQQVLFVNDSGIAKVLEATGCGSAKQIVQAQPVAQAPAKAPIVNASMQRPTAAAPTNAGSRAGSLLSPKAQAALSMLTQNRHK